MSVGTVVVDVIAYVDRLPQRGGDLLARSGRTEPGGASNLLRAAARQGLPVAYAGAIGTGPMADLARAGLAADVVVVAGPTVPGLDTGVCLALVEPDGERTFVTVSGAEACLDEADLAGLALDAAALHVSGYTLSHERNRRAILALLDRLPPGIAVVYDPGPLGALLPADARSAVHRRCTWWSGTVAEAGAEIGAGGAPGARGERGDPGAAAVALAAILPAAGIVVRDGPRGCHVVPPPDGGGRFATHVPGFAVEALDTSGAGDTHVGVFVAGIALGLDPLVAARRANAAAAIAVTRPGPAAAPGPAELDAFLAAASGHGAWFTGR